VNDLGGLFSILRVFEVAFLGIRGLIRILLGSSGITAGRQARLDLDVAAANARIRTMFPEEGYQPVRPIDPVAEHQVPEDRE
jgi:hypothetical protein